MLSGDCCGVDFKMVSEQAQKFGFKFDITKLSIADIKNLLDDIETILKDPKVQCTIMFGSAAYSSYKNNSKLATVTNGYLAYTSFVSANISNDTAAKYTEKANQTIADNVGRKVEETLGDNFASRAISSTTNFIVKQAADTVTGVTGNKVKRGLQSAWDFITDIF